MSSSGTTTSASSTPCTASASNPSRSASMPQLIRHRTIVDDPWTLLRDATSLAELSDGAPVIVPLSLWLVRRAALIARGEAGVWLAPHEGPQALAPDVARLPLIAVDFPQLTDGRGYSDARLFRQRYHYTG